MKKIALILILFIGFSSFAQVSLKDYTLGERLTFSSSLYTHTSVGNIYGTLNASIIADMTIYKVFFYSSEYFEDSDPITTYVSPEMAKDFITAVEENYGIKLRKASNKTGYSNKKFRKAKKDGILFLLIITDFIDDPNATTRLDIELHITNLELEKAKKKEISSNF